MKYTPDHKYNKSNDLIEHLVGGKDLSRTMRDITEEEKIELLVYNIIKKEEHIKLQREQMKEYQSIFDAMSKFIKPKGPTIYK